MKMRTTDGYFSPRMEDLESRLNLSSNPCLIEAPEEGATQQAVHSVNCFASDLFEVYEKEAGNLVVSPFSIASALAMTYAGAEGITADEIADVLHIDAEQSEGSFQRSFSALMGTLANRNGADLDVANAIWADETFPFHQEYMDSVAVLYDAAIENRDFSDLVAVRDEANAWVAEQTRGKIEDLFPELPSLTKMLMANAVYFQSQWLNSFSAEATTDRPFNLSDGSVNQVPTMYAKLEVPYTETDGFQVIEVPFGYSENEFSGQNPNGLSMVFMLPSEGQDVLGPETLSQVMHRLDEGPTEITAVDVFLPKFEHHVSSNLSSVLTGLGAGSMFSPATANLSGMTDFPSFHVMEALHEATISVDENGAEATAATGFIFGIICFAKGTPIATPDGVKSIEDLKVGDLVMSRDEHRLAGEIEAKQIEEVIESRKEIVELHVGGRVIRTTAEHPFFVKEQGWTRVRDISPGDLLASDLASWQEVENIVATGQEETVYNFHVAEHHTYFVGDDDWGFSVWAHNHCGEEHPTAEFRADRTFHYMIRDNATSTILFLGRVSDPTGDTENTINPKVTEDTANVSTGDPLMGDANGDNEVDFLDFLVLSQNYGRTQDVAFADGDFNEDGGIDFNDFLLLTENFGESRDD